MNPRSLAIALLTAGITLACFARPAAACDPARYDTPFDLFDQAVTVAVMKATAVSKTDATLALVEVLKGSAAPGKLEVGLRSTCSPGVDKKGQRGIVYLDADGHMLGLYDGFETDATMVASLRKYGAATTAADRAVPLVELALGRAHSPGYQAAYALANRIDLLQALDVDARERLIARVETGRNERTERLLIVASRLHDPRIAAVQDKRRYEDAANLDGVLAGAFDAESDPKLLAKVVGDAKASSDDRVAAMERCEQVRGKALDRYTEYLYPAGYDDSAEWTARADACRTGTPR